MMGSLLIVLAAGTVTVLAFAAVVYFVLVAEESPFYRFLGRYEDRLERHTRFLLAPYSGSQVARLQVIVVAIAIGLALVFKSFPLIAAAVVTAMLPPYFLHKRHQERILALEQQLDTLLLMLSNALKATPSIGEAIASTINLVPRPFSEEVDLLVKENQLGTPVDRAVKNMDLRIESPVISGALSMIVVGRETGGNLPDILETSAAALREAARLDGVLRTKTAESRGQLFVLAIVPFVLCGVIAWMDPEWFNPMIYSSLGRAILVGSLIVWGVALFWAFKIIDIDL